MSKRRHLFLNKSPKVGKVNRRPDGERASGEPEFKLENEKGQLWKKVRNDRKEPPPA